MKLVKCTRVSDFQFEEETDMDLWNIEGEDDCLGFIQDSELLEIGLE